jgi:hypothetical protein
MEPPMRFKIGMPPAVDCRFHTKTRLVTDYSRVHVIAMILGIVLVGPALYFSWHAFWPNSIVFGTFDQPPEIFIPTLLGVIVIHELVHLLSHPYAGFSRQSVVGMLPKSFLFYASYNGEQSRARLAWTLVAPIVFLTILPLAISRSVPEPVVPFLATLSIMNGLAASGDVLLIFKLFREIPRGARIHGEYFGFPPEAS